MKIAIITAGGAGMFCGSCMQDNTLAQALRMAGQDAVLVPTYTPIRVDEEDVSDERVFLGGINVYLDSVVPGWKYLPRWMTSVLNNNKVISTLSKWGSTDAAKLGALTLDMLRGMQGPQRREIHEFVSYLCNELQPEVIIFSNALLSGVLGELRPRFSGKILCLLQGDDVFLEQLTDRWKPRVLSQLMENCRGFDGFLTHSRFYRDFMVDYLNLPSENFRQIPLTINDHQLQDVTPKRQASEPRREFRIGYFARVCPEKGVHNLLQAAQEVLPAYPHATLAIGGYLPSQHRNWFERLLREAQTKTQGRISWLGSPAERNEKFRLLKTFDLLCVPTDYREPKGLYVLEAGLVDLPVLVPNHGAFPELLQQLGAGTMYDSHVKSGLTDALRTCLDEGTMVRSSLPTTVSDSFGMQTTGPEIVKAITSLVKAVHHDR